MSQNIKEINCDKSRTQMVTKFRKSRCDKTQKLKYEKKKLNSNSDKTQKLKLWQISISICHTTQIATKLKTEIARNSKTQSVMKLKNSNCDRTLKLKLWLT